MTSWLDLWWRFCPASDKFVELQYLNLLMIVFTKNRSIYCNSNCKPKGVPSSFDKSPFAAHFQWYYSVDRCLQSSSIAPISNVLLPIDLQTRRSAKLLQNPTRLTTLVSSVLAVKDISSTYWLMICWEANAFEVTDSHFVFNCCIECLYHDDEQIWG